MQVLIVAKTKMKQGYCVSGIKASDYQNIRLLPNDGRNNQPFDTPFEVGQVWNIKFKAKEQLTPPHTEDVFVLDKKYVGKGKHLAKFLLRHIPQMFDPDPRKLFGGCIQFTDQGTAYINSIGGVPAHSTGFWKTSRELTLYHNQDGKKRYRYEHPLIQFNVPFVGNQDALEVIPPNTLIRLSLARWWKKDHYTEDRCYLQLSGWYS
jgi:hypothetical protein